jgi:hypothetical protein
MKTSPVLCFLVMVSSLLVSLVSASAGVALPLQVGNKHGPPRKRACNPYEHKTVLFDWNALIASGGALWYSIFSYSMDFLAEVSRSQWWTRNRKIAIPPAPPTRPCLSSQCV